MLSLDIQLLRSFVAVSRSGSISTAALQVGRTQSALSMQMQRLEAVIGQPILHRTGNGMRLTTTGERLLVYADRILGVHDEAISDLSGSGLQGLVRFGCPEDYLTAFFPEILRGFNARHPSVEIEVVCAPTVELRPMLHRRQIELAVISLPDDASGGSIIRPESFVWVANSPQPEVMGQKIVPLALSAPDTLDHRAACNAMDKAGRPYRISFASNSLAGLLAVARSGQAISVITGSAVPQDLFTLDDLMPALPGIGIAVVYAGEQPSMAVKAFGAFIQAHLAAA
ncbi:LysR family transcriptional regulator [Tistrella mobilis]|uniref:Transcriptional regulator, LysR family protein n=1 Tax=Tistrella mobilis (strain KA081020-065) TaxID=1110502 RepID=I3TLJ9_TISMK|nr:LysR family transcriptional regulator [Tistrella mobilis]AFK53637.1 transcriptional regulator, LysR family protein [Tistrella mobilis KA081020-065]